MANSYFNENTLEELIEEIKYVYKSDDRPWVIGYSGGKDSTTVVELVYKMLLGLDPEDRHKNIYIVSSDTLIENPLIKIYLSKMNDLLGQAADRDGLPIKSAMVTPPPNNSFWANVIMSKGEFNSVAQVNGGLDNMINWEGKDKDLLALIKYTADEDKLEKVLENPQVIKTPVVRNGNQSTLGYQPDIWKGWN